MSKSKAAIVVSHIIEKVELVVGGLWTVFFGLVILVSIQDDLLNNPATLIVFLMIGAIGVWIFVRGMKRRKMRLQFKKYVTKLSSDPTASLDNIAASSGTSVDVAKKNLEYMIKNKFFSNATLDEDNNTIILGGKTNNMSEIDDIFNEVNETLSEFQSSFNESVTTRSESSISFSNETSSFDGFFEQPKSKKPVYQSCNCPNCGGINKILKGTVSECDFCGSPLEG